MDYFFRFFFEINNLSRILGMGSNVLSVDRPWCCRSRFKRAVASSNGLSEGQTEDSPKALKTGSLSELSERLLYQNAQFFEPDSLITAKFCQDLRFDEL